MIKINLATRKQPSGASIEGKGLNLGGFQFPAGFSKISVNDLKDLPIRKLLLPLVVCVALTYLVDSFKEDEMTKVQDEAAKVAAEKVQLQANAGKLKGYEALKRSMEADEQIMRSKLAVVQGLVADRTNPPKILRSLSSALPKDVWLSEFKAADKEVSFRGFSLDFNQISDFMKNLNESAYFSDVTIKSTQQAKDELGVDVASFDLVAKRR
jgi:Tfp pilus assembly protein PilN